MTAPVRSMYLGKRACDPASGAAVGDPLTGHTDAVTGVVAFAAADGRSLLATTSADRTVRIWDPASGAVGWVLGRDLEALPVGYPRGEKRKKPRPQPQKSPEIKPQPEPQSQPEPEIM